MAILLRIILELQYIDMHNAGMIMAECNELITKTAKTMMMVNMKAVMQIVDKNLFW